jgi:hypothetical protein
VGEKSVRTSVHLDFKTAYWMGMNSSSKGKTLPLSLSGCAYCGAPEKPNSYKWITSSINGKWLPSDFETTLPVYLTLPLCEVHSPKPKEEENKGNWLIYVWMALYIGAIILLTNQFHKTSFFASKALQWSAVTAAIICTIVALLLFALVDRIKKWIKKEPKPLPPAVLIDGNLDFHFLWEDCAHQLQRKIEDARISLERWSNRSYEEQMEEGTGHGAH